MDESLLYLLKELLNRNRIKINNDELKLQLLGHPSYPSLHSITGVLNHFNIPNLAVEIPKTKENINYLPDHFIAHINDEHGENFVLVDKFDQDFKITRNKNKTERIKLEQFQNIWTGIVMGIEDDELELENRTANLNISQALLYLSPFVIISIFIYLRPEPPQSLHFILSVIGILICALITIHENGTQSKLLDKFCTGGSEKINCNDVLNSKGAQFFGKIKLGDIGIIYFLGLTIFSILTILSHQQFTNTYLISVAALPFTLYSIYYQSVVVKKWCLLCLSVVLVLWIQSGVALLEISNNSHILLNISSLSLALISLYVSITFWMFISTKLKSQSELLNLKIQHHKFKRNFEIFNSLLSQKKSIDTHIPNCDEIVFGSKDPGLEITLITNPLCSFCKNAHKLIHPVLKRDLNIKVTVRFNLSKDTNNPAHKIASKLLEIYHTKGEQECLTAMNEVYSDASYLKWLEKWGNAKNKDYSKILNKEVDWCTQNNILFTPEVLFNGKSYPKEYDFEDAQYFIDDLIEIEETIEEEFATV
ncbi:vitamin K epoxide reductase family protein [Ancylomarina subtilis]|nr:vitamin K epoxide reductase family protein [Ancylomarina subtilis]